MQNTASLPADQFDELLHRLPAGLDLDQLARQTKAIQRKRALTSGPDLLRLALARGPGGLSLSEAAAWATILGLARMSDPAVKKRLDKAVAFRDAVMASLLAQRAPGTAMHWSGRVLRNADGSCYCERGSKTTSWRLHAVYDLGRGGFSHLELTDKHGAERSSAARRSRARSALATAILPVPQACDASASKVRTRRISSSG